MIELVGVGEGQEYEAALHLRKQILAVWPDLSQHTDDHVKIFVGLKLYGHPIEDIDLFVVGHFPNRENSTLSTSSIHAMESLLYRAGLRSGTLR